MSWRNPGGPSRPFSSWPLRVVSALLAVAALPMAPRQALAVPAFAAQTGQPCQMCHVGGLGPQLTPFGRSFKIHGYTLRSTAFNVPLSAMLEASYVSTAKAAPQPVAPHYAANDNFTIDQISLFVAGGLGSHLGAFIQTTYDGVARAFNWDQLDVRAVTTVNVKGNDVVLGTSFNNNPAVQDPWNTLPAWGFPYSSSSLAPTPTTAPLLSGALAQTSLGMTVYAWINSALYLEAGGYVSPPASTLTRLGVDPTSPGSINGVAPYARVEFQKTVGGGTLAIGAFGLGSRIYPGLDQSTGETDHYTDLGLDGSYYMPLSNNDVITVNSHYLHEQQWLDATCILAMATSCAQNNVTDLRADVSYYWRNKVGGTIQVFDTFGSDNPTLYAANRIPDPDSNGVMFQLDVTPFGGLSQPRRRINLRVGVQYTLYTKFNGAASNFDNQGTNASDDNTFRVFTWLAF